MLRPKSHEVGTEMHRINIFQKESVLIAVQRCTEDLSSILKITYPTCYEADPNALYPS